MVECLSHEPIITQVKLQGECFSFKEDMLLKSSSSSHCKITSTFNNGFTGGRRYEKVVWVILIKGVKVRSYKCCPKLLWLLARCVHATTVLNDWNMQYFICKFSPACICVYDDACLLACSGLGSLFNECNKRLLRKSR